MQNARSDINCISDSREAQIKSILTPPRQNYVRQNYVKSTEASRRKRCVRPRNGEFTPSFTTIVSVPIDAMPFCKSPLQPMVNIFFFSIVVVVAK